MYNTNESNEGIICYPQQQQQQHHHHQQQQMLEEGGDRYRHDLVLAGKMKAPACRRMSLFELQRDALACEAALNRNRPAGLTAPAAANAIPRRTNSDTTKARPAKASRRTKMSRRKHVISSYYSQHDSPVISTKTKKSVRFVNPTEPTVLAYRPECTEQEIRDTWYQPLDYGRFERSRRQTIDAIKTVNGDMSMLDPREYCLTGLEEQITRKQVLSRRLKAIHYTRLVLEQHGKYKPTDLQHEQCKAIADMFSRQAMKRAQLRALLNEVQAHDMSDDF